jgi:hypothetical protein
MGFKYRKLPRPAGWFDYRVGPLGTFWWSTGDVLNISDAATLRWKAYLILPPFITKRSVDQARAQATAKHAEIPYANAAIETLREGRSVQILHVGPYDKEQPTIDLLHEYMRLHSLVMNGHHHEIYISDPRRTKPDRLKTVIRFAVKLA